MERIRPASLRFFFAPFFVYDVPKSLHRARGQSWSDKNFERYRLTRGLDVPIWPRICLGKKIFLSADKKRGKLCGNEKKYQVR